MCLNQSLGSGYIICLMGNSGGSARQAQFKDFQMQKYLNQGLNQNQIIQIKEAFDYCEPDNGRIKLHKLRIATENSQAKQKIESYMRNRDSMDFDEFFAMSKELLQDEIKKNPGMIIDTDEVEATCFFCPYAIDKKR